MTYKCQIFVCGEEDHFETFVAYEAAQAYGDGYCIGANDCGCDETEYEIKEVENGS